MKLSLNNEGVALVTAILVAAVLSILSMALLGQVVTENRIADREVASTQAFYLAEAGAERAIYELMYGEDVIDDYGNVGHNGLPDLFEQLHGLNSFSISQDGLGPIVDSPLTLTFVIGGNTVTVDLSSITPQHQLGLENFEPNKFGDTAIPFSGSCYGKPIIMDLNGDGIPEILVGTDRGEVHYYKYVQKDRTFTVQEVFAEGNKPFITGLDGGIIGNITVRDMDLNGHLDIIFNTRNGHVYNYEIDKDTGKLKLKWDHEISGAKNTYWELAVGNLDSDSPLEIVVPANDAGLVFLDDNGTKILTIPKSGYGFSAPPLIGDFDKDGHNEVVADDGIYLHCYERDGTKKWTYRVALKVDYYDGSLYEDENGKRVLDPCSDEFWAPSPSMGDVDGDGYPEIVTTSQGSGNWKYRNTHTVVLKDDNRTIVDTEDINGNGDITEIINVPNDVRVNLTPSAREAGFGDKLDELHSHRQPTVGDWNNDGIREIFHGVCIDQVYMFSVDFDNIDGGFYNIPATETDVGWMGGSYEFADFSGDDIPDFPAGIGGSGDVHASPVFANVDYDPELEIVFATMNGGGHGGSVIVLDNTVDPETGNLNVWRQVEFPGNESFHSGVAVADLNQDGIEEVIMASSEHGNFGGTHYLYVFGLRGMKFARTRITATALGDYGIGKGVSTIVDLTNPASLNPTVTFQSWQE